MPYILYLLGAHSAKYLSRCHVTVGYGRALAWRPRIMRVSLLSMSYVLRSPARALVWGCARRGVGLRWRKCQKSLFAHNQAFTKSTLTNFDEL